MLKGSGRRVVLKAVACVLAIGLALPTGLYPGSGKAEAADPDVYPEPRDPWLWPFSQDSIWNTPIGSDAEYVSGGHFPGQGYVHADDEIHLKAKETDPVRTIYSPGSWTNRCSGTTPGEFESSMHFPDGVIVPDAITTGGVYETPNNVAAILKPDGQTLVQLEPLCRTVPDGPVYGYQYPRNENIYEQGINGTHWGSGLSGIGGSIRTGELTGSGPIRHALKLNVWGKYLYYDQTAGKGYRWPADRHDNAAPSNYHGTDPNIQMGSLMAIKPDVTPEDLGITTEPGLKIFHALQDYGAYIADDTGWDAYALSLSYEARYEFQEVYGYSFNQGGGGSGEAADYYNDMIQMIEHLYVIDNNTEDNIGGGGTPRAPLASPDFVPMDNVPPTVPTELSVAGRTTNSIDLTWTASTDNVRIMQYNIYRDGVLAGSTYGRTSYTVTGLNRNTPYTFEVKAIDTNLNESALSTEANARTYDGYSINFDDGTVPRWTLSNTGVEYGRLKLANWGGTASAVYDDRMFSPGTGSYRYKADIYNISNENSAKTALWFNVQDENNRYEVTFGGGTSNTVELNKIVDGATVTLAVYSDTGGASLSYPIRDAASITVTFEHGGFISVSGQSGGAETVLFDRVQNSTFQAGKIGIGSRYTESFADNVSVVIEGGDDAPDTAPPTTPSAFEAGRVTATTVQLQWQSSSDNVGVKEYVIFRDGAEIARTNATSYKVTELERDTAYAFHVAAADDAGNLSANSGVVEVTTLEVDTYKSYETSFESGDAPGWLLSPGFAVESNQLKMDNWGGISRAIYDGDVYSGHLMYSADVSGWGSAESNAIALLFHYQDDQNYYAVEGGGGGTVVLKKRVEGQETVLDTYTGSYSFKDGARIAIDYQDGKMTVTGSKGGANTTLFDEVEDSALTHGKIGISGAYNVLFADQIVVEAELTDAYPPSVPTGLRTTTVGSEAASLAWNASTDNESVAGYEIYVDGVNKGWTINTSYELSDLEGGTTYSVRVLARDTAGNRSLLAEAISVQTLPSTKLPRTNWVASASSTAQGNPPERVLDGSLTTRWSSGQAMENGQWFAIDLGQATAFDRIVIDAGSSTGDYLRGYEIQVSSDGEQWSEPIAAGEGAVVTNVSFDPVTARFVRVMQTASSGNWWSIHELNIHLEHAGGDGDGDGDGEGDGEGDGDEDGGGDGEGDGDGDGGGDGDGESDGGDPDAGGAGGGNVAPAKPAAVRLDQNAIPSASGQNIAVTLEQGQSAVVIPVQLLQNVGDKSIAVQANGITVTLPSQFLQKTLQDADAESTGSQFVLTVKPLAKADMPTLAAQGGTIALAGQGYELTLELKAADGKSQSIKQFERPVSLSFPVGDGSVGLPAIYYISSEGQLEYAGGKLEEGRVTADVNHFSVYAPLSYVPQFDDLPRTHWAYKAAQSIASRFIDKWGLAGSFEPYQAMTRGAFADDVSRAMNIVSTTASLPFQDVASDDPNARAIAALYEAGIINGVNSRQYAPERIITRQEAVTILIRASHYTAASPATQSSLPLPFADASAISSWAISSVEEAWSKGWIKGKTELLFDPHAPLTRAEVVQLLSRMIAH